MKKALILFAFSVLTSAIVIGIAALIKGDEKSCTDHKDYDENGLCDICDSEFSETAEDHGDKDHDGLWDTVGCEV